MWNLTIKNIIANKARMAMITMAVIIGVGFVSSTFVFSDSLSKTFTQLSTDISSGTDLEVRPIETFGSSASLTNETVATVEQLDGVRAVGAIREAEDVVPVTPAGELLDSFGVGLSWVEDSQLNTFDVTSGNAPGPGEFAMSANAAERVGFVVGETYGVSTPAGVVDRTLSGLTVFRGGESIEANLTFTFLTLTDTQALFGGTADQVDALVIAVDNDASAVAVQAQAQAALSDQLEVVSQRTVQQEQQARFNSQISLLRNLLLGFAVVSLFVSTFIIYNTFGIILNQRVREIGLLRAIGADSGHIARSVIGEAVIIGAIASVGGLLAGLALNKGLIALLGSFGASFPEMETVVATRTVVIAVAIGLGVTVLSALGPARQASRVAPITAMRGVSEQREDLRRRVTVGAALAFAGVLSASFGLFSANGTQSVLTFIGLGIAAVFIGVTLLSPALSRPIINAIGAPLARVAGASGELARGNAARNRRRTASTAAALMIGLSLITTTLVVGQSVKQHLSNTLTETVSADFVISNDFDPMTDELVNVLWEVDELGAVVAVSEVDAMLADEVRTVEAVTFATLDQLFDIGVSSGTVPSGAANGAMLVESMATDLGLGLGDPLELTFENGSTQTFTIEALYTDTTLLDSGVLVGRSMVDQVLPLSTVEWIAAGVNADASVTQATAALAAATADYPQADVQTSTEYREAAEAQVDQLLSIVNVMLALSIVIALIGIGLTLALSVFERTREIGLLRAVGMSTRQVRRMIRWEAALIAGFGAVLGVATGLVYGWGTVTALPESIASTVAIPFQRLALLVLTSAFAGLIAALLPARRAARMNVLDAITGR